MLRSLQSGHLIGHALHPAKHDLHALAEGLSAHVHRLQLAVQLLGRLEPSLGQRLVSLSLDDLRGARGEAQTSRRE